MEKATKKNTNKTLSVKNQHTKNAQNRAKITKIAQKRQTIKKNA